MVMFVLNVVGVVSTDADMSTSAYRLTLLCRSLVNDGINLAYTVIEDHNKWYDPL